MLLAFVYSVSCVGSCPASGCFTPQCDSAERRVFRNVSQGSVKTVLGLTLDSGDLICSTGQVGKYKVTISHRSGLEPCNIFQIMHILLTSLK